MRNILLVPAFAMVLAAASAAPAAAPPPVDHRQIVQLITQLGSARFKEREAATQALEAIGEPALEALQRAALSNDPEIGRRAQNLAHTVRRQIDTARFLAPRRLRLVYRETPILQAVEDFAHRSGFPIAVVGDRARLADRKITLDTGDTSFWEAFQQFCQRAELQERTVVWVGSESDLRRQAAVFDIRPLGGAMRMTDVASSNPGSARLWDGRLILVDGPPPPRPTCYAGAVRIRALPAKGAMPDAESGDILFLLEITPQPKSAWQHVVELRIDKAVDGTGQDVAALLDTRSELNQLAATANGAVRWDAQAGHSGATCRDVPVRFKSGDRPTGIVKELRGVVVAQIQTEPQTILSVDDIFKAIGRPFRDDDGDFLKVTEAERQAQGVVHLRVELIEASAANALWVVRGGVMRPNRLFRRGLAATDFSSSPANLLLLDSEGQSLPLRSRTEELTMNGNALARLITLTYQGGVGEPRKLLYAGRRTILIEIPFTLRDIPLP